MNTCKECHWLKRHLCFVACAPINQKLIKAEIQASQAPSTKPHKENT